MNEAEKVLAVVPKAWLGLDEWIVFFTNYRAIVTRFDAWGSAMGWAALIGWFTDDARRREIMATDPNLLLSRDKHAFEIPFQFVTQVVFKKGLVGATITFHVKDGRKFVFKMDSRKYFNQAMLDARSALGEKVVVK
ncbi:MAG: PH domain-containing protein [Thermoplasmata archaeon]|nr:MAG: PH domain-containing protein [Thermoplasmata archaeon]